MNKKIKILLIILGIFSLSGAGLSAWIYFSAQTEIAGYVRKHTELEKRNSRLGERLDAAQKEARRWQGKSGSVTAALNKLGKEYTFLQSQYTSLLKEKDSLVQEYKGIRGQLVKLKALYSEEQKKPKKIDTSDEFLSSLLEEKAVLQVEIEKLREQIEDIEREARPHEEKFTQLEKEKKDLETKLKDIEEVSDVLSNDLLQERRKRAALEEELANTKKKEPLEQKPAEGTKRTAPKTEPPSIELSPIIVKAEEPPPQPPKSGKVRAVEEEAFELEGHIITVNDKHRFVVIDIGRDAGVKEGMPFNVYRRGKKVGKIEVLETRENIAACDIKEMKVKRLKAKDTVRR